jgi:hypothetical protein
VEHNFRTLDRRVRERIALWEGAKGALLEEIMGERDAIADSDQGKSFRAFWDFLMSQSRQEELSRLLEQVLVPAADPRHAARTRLQRVHYDWLEAGEHTQRTVAKLSEQLRRFLDDQAWLENRRIMDILHSIENHAPWPCARHPAGGFHAFGRDRRHGRAAHGATSLPAAAQALIADVALDEGDADVDTAALYAQVVVDRAELTRNIRQALAGSRSQISLPRWWRAIRCVTGWPNWWPICSWPANGPKRRGR